MTDRAGRALSVNPNACTQHNTPLAGNIFRTLSAAVQASQPGDTIHLVAGVQHVVQNVVIPWPLHLKGSGSGCSWSQVTPSAIPGHQSVDTTMLVSPAGADSALEIRYEIDTVRFGCVDVVS